MKRFWLVMAAIWTGCLIAEMVTGGGFEFPGMMAHISLGLAYLHDIREAVDS